MKYIDSLTPGDRRLATDRLADFIPAEIYDIHAHAYHTAHFAPSTWSFLTEKSVLGCIEHRTALQRYMQAQTIHGLYFGLPHKTADRLAMNAWVKDEVREHGTEISRTLMVASPTDNQTEVAMALRSKQFCGLKVYHCYSGRPDTINSAVNEYAPEWMWEILHEVQGVLMLHIVRDGAIEDPSNQASIKRLCQAYPKATLILAHVARSFNYRNARHGLHAISDLENAVVDTSAICETETFRTALKIFGPKRVLWGSDFAISELRGRCVTTGERFFWLHPESIRPDVQGAAGSGMTLVGIESLLCLREACEDTGLTRADIDDIFLRNALRILTPHLPADLGR